MPRRPGGGIGGVVYHALNRAVVGTTLFSHDRDYQAFETVIREAQGWAPVRILDYSLMPNHWHLILWPRSNGDLSEFMRWLQVTHVKRWRAFRRTVGRGHLYQGSFKSFPVQTDAHFLTVCRYVERNPVRADLVVRAEEWRCGSLWRRMHGDADQRALLDDWPVDRPRDWLTWVNTPLSEAEVADVRESVTRGRPFGSPRWQARTAGELGLKLTMRRRGRPIAR
jgi:putative transposase